MIPYRREVDGLRAIAVLPVMLFHAGFNFFSGGFVGVDIFFVISGYLITGIIISEIHTSSFSLLKFYERRIRRIIPALFLVTFFSFILALLLLPPFDMRFFSKSLVAVSTFSSNILFFLESDYFESASDLKPLLHTWSLAVEEQFYFIFPLFLLLLWKCRVVFQVTGIALLLLASLVFSHWATQNYPEMGFYFLPARAWELMLGALCAYYLSSNRVLVVSMTTREVLGGTGLILIVASIALFDANTIFPGFAALLPTMGTVLLILFSSSEDRLGRFLGNRVFVSIGLVSYSAYLWHQPLFAFARHSAPYEPEAIIFIVLTFVSFILAYGTWRFVEQPFRRRQAFSQRQIFVLWFLASLLMGGAGLIGYFTDGYFFRVGLKERMPLAEYTFLGNLGLNSACDSSIEYSPVCQTHEKPEVMIWGDSYAMHLVDGFIASDPDIRMIQRTVSFCGPILGAAPVTRRYTKEWARACLNMNDDVLAYLKDNPSIKYVVMSSRFHRYIDADNALLLSDGSLVPSDGIGEEYLMATISTLKSLGVTPVIFSPPAEMGGNIGRCLVRMTYLGVIPKCATSLLMSLLSSKEQSSICLKEQKS